jgi:hypothetical protein
MEYEEENLRRIEKNIQRGFKYYDQQGNLLRDAQEILWAIENKNYVNVKVADGHMWEVALHKGLVYMREPKTERKLEKKTLSPWIEDSKSIPPWTEDGTTDTLGRLGGLTWGSWLWGIGIFLYFVGFLASITMSTPNFSDLDSVENYYNTLKMIYVLLFFAPVLCFAGIGLMIVGFYEDWRIGIRHQLRK